MIENYNRICERILKVSIYRSVPIADKKETRQKMNSFNKYKIERS